jgi:hypothetical protein
MIVKLDDNQTTLFESQSNNCPCCDFRQVHLWRWFWLKVPVRGPARPLGLLASGRQRGAAVVGPVPGGAAGGRRVAAPLRYVMRPFSPNLAREFYKTKVVCTRSQVSKGSEAKLCAAGWYQCGSGLSVTCSVHATCQFREKYTREDCQIHVLLILLVNFTLNRCWYPVPSSIPSIQVTPTFLIRGDSESKWRWIGRYFTKILGISGLHGWVLTSNWPQNLKKKSLFPKKFIFENFGFKTWT